MWRNVKDVFGWFSCQCSVLTNMTHAVVIWVEWWFWDSYSASWSWNGGKLPTDCLRISATDLLILIEMHKKKKLQWLCALRTSTFSLNRLTFSLPLLRRLSLVDITNAFPRTYYFRSIWHSTEPTKGQIVHILKLNLTVFNYYFWKILSSCISALTLSGSTI